MATKEQQIFELACQLVEQVEKEDGLDSVEQAQVFNIAKEVRLIRLRMREKPADSEPPTP